jgi:hypothetical protein
MGIVEKCGKCERLFAAIGGAGLSGAGFCQANGAEGIPALRACSACAGDYEDPERGAWPTDKEIDETRGDAEETNADEFPAKKQ